MPQIVGSKVGTTLDYVVSLIGKESAVAGVVIIVPHVCGKPRTCKRREVPRHILARQGRSESKDIGRYRCCPSTCTEICLGSNLTRLDESTDEVEQRLFALAEVGLACRPVVHLHIDIGVIVYTPRSVNVVVPYTLEVGWHIARTRRGDEQIAAKLIVELFEIEVLLTATIVAESLVDRHVLDVGCCVVDVELNAIEQTGVVIVMLLEQRLIALGNSLVNPLTCCRLGIDTYISLSIVEVGIVVGLVVSIGSDDEHHLVSTLNGNLAVMIVDRTALCHRLHTYAILHIIIVETSVPQEFVVAFGYHLALRNGVLGIRKHEILHSLTRSLEAYRHDIGRIADEVFACVADAILGKRHYSQS